MTRRFALLAFAMAAALTLPHPGAAQTPATGSISGRVLSEDGRTLQASVTLSHASPRGYPAPPRRAFTDAHGAFSFTRLPTGRYALCAQIAASEPSPANSPFVDTCVWGSGQAPIDVAAGQQVAGVVFTAPKGAWLKVRMVDPDHVLPQAVPAKGPAMLEPELQLILQGPDKLFRHARFVSSDSAGRTYQLAIPLKTALGLTVTSAVADVFDQSGKQVKEKDKTGLQPNTPAEINPVTFTLHRKGP